MQITIDDKLIQRCVNDMLDYTFYHDYQPNVLKAAGVPKKTLLSQTLLNDKEFMSNLQEYLQDLANDADTVSGALYEVDCKILNKLQAACEEARTAVGRKTDVDRAVELLREAGYKVSKK